VADLVFTVADIVVADMVCGLHRCNSSGVGIRETELDIGEIERSSLSIFTSS